MSLARQIPKRLFCCCSAHQHGHRFDDVRCKPSILRHELRTQANKLKLPYLSETCKECQNRCEKRCRWLFWPARKWRIWFLSSSSLSQGKLCAETSIFQVITLTLTSDKRYKILWFHNGKNQKKILFWRMLTNVSWKKQLATRLYFVH